MLGDLLPVIVHKRSRCEHCGRPSESIRYRNGRQGLSGTGAVRQYQVVFQCPRKSFSLMGLELGDDLCMLVHMASVLYRPGE